MIEIRKIPVGRGAGWIGDGWRIFTASPGMWVVLTIIWVLISLVLQAVPLAGMLATLFVAPILGGGLLLAADDVRRGRELDVGTLFRPVTDPATRNPMLVLGGIYLGANMAVFLATMLIVIAGMGAAIMHNGMPSRPPRIDPAQVDPSVLFAMGGIFIAVALLILTLVLLITILFYFAIPLVAFGRTEPGNAIATGTRALLRNWAPLTILGLLYIPLSLLATIPLALGWLVLLPMTIGMWYASYRDVFPAHETGADAGSGIGGDGEDDAPIALPASPET
jgi:uncharacterized membrane protein